MTPPTEAISSNRSDDLLMHDLPRAPSLDPLYNHDIRHLPHPHPPRGTPHAPHVFRDPPPRLTLRSRSIITTKGVRVSNQGPIPAPACT